MDKGRSSGVVYLERAVAAKRADNPQRQARERAYRIERTIAMLWSRPDKRYAVHTEFGPDGNVIVTIAIRGVAAFEMSMPRAKYDTWNIIQSTIKHRVTVGE